MMYEYLDMNTYKRRTTSRGNAFPASGVGALHQKSAQSKFDNVSSVLLFKKIDIDSGNSEIFIDCHLKI